MLFVFHPKILYKHCFQFLLVFKIAPRGNWRQCLCKILCWQTKSIFVCYGISGVVNTNSTMHAKVLLCTHPSPIMDKNQSDLKALEKSRLGVVFLHWLRTRRESFLPKAKCNNLDPKQWRNYFSKSIERITLSLNYPFCFSLWNLFREFSVSAG